MITDRDRRRCSCPNLIGNAPDWDRIARDRRSATACPVIEDSCDTLGARAAGHARPGERSTLSVTSFANSHIITCAGNGGMVMIDDDALRDRALMLRRWGRRSELHFFGSKQRDRDFWEDLDGIHYDNQFIFDELAWNFEPSEMGAAFGLEQLKKLPENLARRRRNFDRYTEFFAQPRRSLRAAAAARRAGDGVAGLPAHDRRPTPGSSAPTCSSSSTAAASTPAPSGPAT